MQHHTRHTLTDQSGRWLWHPRTCGRRTVTLRVDYATADGRVWQGLIRNLSLQGMQVPAQKFFDILHAHAERPGLD